MFFYLRISNSPLDGRDAIAQELKNGYIYTMWTFYRDVTLYTVTLCIFLGMATAAAYDSFASGLVNMLLIFGIFGTGFGVLAFSYFQKAQYYMYHNLGFTKKHLILKTWAVNFGIGILVALFIAIWI